MSRTNTTSISLRELLKSATSGRRRIGTVRHYQYTCAACGRNIESTTSRYSGSVGLYVCRSRKKCGNPEERQRLIEAWKWEASER